MRNALLIAAAVALYLLHQDFWFWRAARPMVFGLMPVGLFYHACYTVAATLLMWLLVSYAWPAHLEEDVERKKDGSRPSEDGSRPPEDGAR